MRVSCFESRFQQLGGEYSNIRPISVSLWQSRVISALWVLSGLSSIILGHKGSVSDCSLLLLGVYVLIERFWLSGCISKRLYLFTQVIIERSLTEAERSICLETEAHPSVPTAANSNLKPASEERQKITNLVIFFFYVKRNNSSSIIYIDKIHYTFKSSSSISFNT